MWYKLLIVILCIARLSPFGRNKRIGHSGPEGQNLSRTLMGPDKALKSGVQQQTSGIAPRMVCCFVLMQFCESKNFYSDLFLNVQFNITPVFNGKNLVPLKLRNATESYYFFQEVGKQLERESTTFQQHGNLNHRPCRSATFTLKWHKHLLAGDRSEK